MHENKKEFMSYLAKLQNFMSNMTVNCQKYCVTKNDTKPDQTFPFNVKDTLFWSNTEWKSLHFFFLSVSKLHPFVCLFTLEYKR